LSQSFKLFVLKNFDFKLDRTFSTEYANENASPKATISKRLSFPEKVKRDFDTDRVALTHMSGDSL